jgi:hypothetical protein
MLLLQVLLALLLQHIFLFLLALGLLFIEFLIAVFFKGIAVLEKLVKEVGVFAGEHVSGIERVFIGGFVLVDFGLADDIIDEAK